MTTIFPTQLSDTELLDATVRAARDERRASAALLTLLAEVDARRLYLGEGCSSLFSYCTQVLFLSEHAAYHRIEAARAARQHPVILELVEKGELTLTTVAMLRPHLTEDSHLALLEAARHKSKREVEYQIACFAPKPAVGALIRRVPAPRSPEPTAAQSTGGGANASIFGADEPGASLVHGRGNVMSATAEVSGASGKPRAKVAPLAGDRYLLRVTLSAGAHAKLRRAQDLMRHTVPNGEPAEILEKALSLLVAELERKKIAQLSRPRAASRRTSPSASGSRHIPAAVRREVWVRDEGRCAFIGPRGRCTETGHLEYHHVIPFARGGSTDVANIALRCRAHNGFESELLFSKWARPPAQRTRSGPS